MTDEQRRYAEDHPDADRKVDPGVEQDADDEELPEDEDSGADDPGVRRDQEDGRNV